MPFQRDLAEETGLHQSRVSMFETPGMSNMTLETLAKVGAGLRCGVIVKFVPFSEMLSWENSFSPDTFDVLRLEDDEGFISPDGRADTPISGIGSSSRRIHLLETSGSAGAGIDEGSLGASPIRIPPASSQRMETINVGIG